MVYAPDTGRSQPLFAHTLKLGLLPDASGGEPGSFPPRDLKKRVLILGLGALSWVATYVGMLELIQANMGELPLVHKLIIGFSVAMLMTMIIWLLDQMFSPIGTPTRLAYIAGYLFLSLISVGFGFGFYWKVLESRGESSRSAELAVTGVQTSLNAASTRLEQLNATLLQLAAVSRQKAETERETGKSCPNSKPGDGPRRRMREADAERFSFASDFVAGRVGALKTDMAALDGDLVKIAGNDPSLIDPKSGTRNAFMKDLGRKLDMTVSSFNALRGDPQLQQLRQDLADRAAQTTFGDPKAGGFVCPDVELAQALRGAVRALSELPVLETPAIAAVEGPEATIEAFRRLTTTFYGLLSFKLPPSADELRALQKKAIQSVEHAQAGLPSTDGGGLTQRDYVPLGVAVFVDICLLLVSIGRPGHRMAGLVPKMREAERGPVIEILSRFNDIHRDPEIRESFELFRHVVFDLHGAYYVAVPLDAPPHLSRAEREELRTEAQLLANLFTSFEQDRIFKRTWTPFNGAVQKMLERQGSKFAGSEAFRVYKFRHGAWSEIILGAVMGAARRAEAEASRRRIERDLLHPEPILRPEPALRHEPRFTARTDGPAETWPTEIWPTDTSLSGAELSDVDRADAPEPVEPLVAPTAAGQPPQRTAAKPPPAARMDAPRRPPLRPPHAPSVPAMEGFGPYARSAAAEFRSVLEADEAEATADLAPAPAETEDTDNAAPATAIPVETAAAEPAAAGPRVDVVLKRETATLSLPLPSADDENGLIGRLAEALRPDRMEEAEAQRPLALAEAKAGSPRLPQIEALAAIPGDEGDITRRGPEVIDTDATSSNRDAATIARRLNPAKV